MSGADGSGLTTGVDMIALATAVGRIETAVQYLKEQGDRADQRNAAILAELGRRLGEVDRALSDRLGGVEGEVADLAARVKVIEGNGTLLRTAAPNIITSILAVIAFLMGLGALINYGG